jgi:hypothetical protein
VTSLEKETQPSSREAAGPSGAVDLLTSPLFVAAVALLILNDWYLKAVFGNALTGKLSDFAGLTAFTIFWAALLPRWRRTVFTGTAAAFILWKSPLSEGLLTAWNAVAPLQLDRVIDYTDWIALIVLIPVYWSPGTRDAPTARRPATASARRLAAAAAGAIAILSFSATSFVTNPPGFAIPASWALPGSIPQVRSGLGVIGITSEVNSRRPYAAPTDDEVTLTLYIRHPPERPVAVIVRLRAVQPERTDMMLLSAASRTGHTLEREAVHRAFNTQVYEPLLAFLTSREPR